MFGVDDCMAASFVWILFDPLLLTAFRSFLVLIHGEPPKDNFRRRRKDFGVANFMRCGLKISVREDVVLVSWDVRIGLLGSVLKGSAIRKGAW